MIRPYLHLWLYKRSPARDIIEKDVVRWVDQIEPARSKDSIVENLTWLLNTEVLAEYRNLFYYRIGHPSGVLDRLFLSLARLFYKPRNLLSIETSQIGSGFIIKHGFNAVIRAERIGTNCMIFQGVTIGSKHPGGGLPILGDHVHISTGAKVLGPITIGDYSVVAANSVVTKDMPMYGTAAGVPARIMKRRNADDGAAAS